MREQIDGALVRKKYRRNAPKSMLLREKSFAAVLRSKEALPRTNFRQSNGYIWPMTVIAVPVANLKRWRTRIGPVLVL